MGQFSNSPTGSSFFLSVVLLLVPSRANAFFSQDVMRYYEKGDLVPLMVNKMTSTKTLFPVGHYQLPFCQPEGGPKLKKAGLGDRLVGNRIESSPYRIRMMEDSFCEQLCVMDLGRDEREGTGLNKFVRAIRNEYRRNWIVDDLPAGSIFEDYTQITRKYWDGIPIGFVGYNELSYAFNHVNIEIRYNPLKDEPEKATITRFTVQPFSIKHKFEIPDNYDGDNNGHNDIKVLNPIASCDSKNLHTEYDTIMNGKYGWQPQPASGATLFTYDVKWIKDENLSWASRWDIYLNMDNSIPASIHWLTITNSLFTGIWTLLIVVAILVRFLQNNLSIYRKLEDEEKEELLTESGWKLVHADVFRPPTFSPLLLSAVCGTGAQLVATTSLTIISLLLGFLTPARGGDIIFASLAFYAFMGMVAGYVSARWYGLFQGKSWRLVASLTALIFPTACFLIFLMTNLLAYIQQSTYVVTFGTICCLLFLYAFICIPLVFCGSYLGFKKEALKFPVNTNSPPRKIPKQPWHNCIPVTLVVGGILPFGASQVEIYYLLSSIWRGMYYNYFGFLIVTVLLVYIHCAGITILFNALLFEHENYQWWWRSFSVAGSVSLFLFFYSYRFCYLSDLSSFFFYFGSMSLTCFAVFLMTGYVGFSISYMFNVHIFSSIVK